MTRISPLVAFDEDALSLLDPAARTSERIAGVMAHRPEAYAAWREFGTQLKATGTLSPRLVELVRIRIAFHNQCRSCMALRYSDAVEDGVTEAVVCSLQHPAEADDLTAAEKAALRFADLYATDHLAIDGEVLDQLRAHFDEGEIVELALHCVRCVGFGRLAAILSVVEDVPERFREPSAEPYVPWDGETMTMTVPSTA